MATFFWAESCAGSGSKNLGFWNNSPLSVCHYSACRQNCKMFSAEEDLFLMQYIWQLEERKRIGCIPVLCIFLLEEFFPGSFFCSTRRWDEETGFFLYYTCGQKHAFMFHFKKHLFLAGMRGRTLASTVVLHSPSISLLFLSLASWLVWSPLHQSFMDHIFAHIFSFTNSALWAESQCVYVSLCVSLFVPFSCDFFGWTDWCRACLVRGLMRSRSQSQSRSRSRVEP